MPSSTSPASRRPARAFTLVEVTVVMVVLAIASAVAVASSQPVLDRLKTKEQFHAFTKDMIGSVKELRAQGYMTVVRWVSTRQVEVAGFGVPDGSLKASEVLCNDFKAQTPLVRVPLVYDLKFQVFPTFCVDLKGIPFVQGVAGAASVHIDTQSATTEGNLERFTIQASGTLVATGTATLEGLSFADAEIPAPTRATPRDVASPYVVYSADGEAVDTEAASDLKAATVDLSVIVF